MKASALFKAGNIQQYALNCRYKLHQAVDYTGRPSSVTRGGTIELVFQSTDNTDLFEWMCNNFERKDGVITFQKMESEGVMKELAFKEGYLVSYTEQFYADTGKQMDITIVISANEIAIGNSSHKNAWI